MPSYNVAHLHEQGVDIVIVPMDASFGRRTSDEQHGFMDELQMRSVSAGLRGTVVPVWPGGFIAPSRWHPFFRTLPLRAVYANLNKTISW